MNLVLFAAPSLGSILIDTALITSMTLGIEGVCGYTPTVEEASVFLTIT